MEANSGGAAAEGKEAGRGHGEGRAPGVPAFSKGSLWREDGECLAGGRHGSLPISPGGPGAVTVPSVAGTRHHWLALFRLQGNRGGFFEFVPQIRFLRPDHVPGSVGIEWQACGVGDTGLCHTAAEGGPVPSPGEGSRGRARCGEPGGRKAGTGAPGRLVCCRGEGMREACRSWPGQAGGLRQVKYFSGSSHEAGLQGVAHPP